MPVVHTYCSAPIPEGARETLKAAYGRAIEAVPGKSEAWLMCLFEGSTPIYFAGERLRALRLCRGWRVRALRGSRRGVGELHREVTPVISRELGVDPSRLYIRYGWTPSFGWNGANF